MNNLLNTRLAADKALSFMDKRIWITGASSGIGEALCYELSNRGARLILSSRNESILAGVVQRCAHPERHLVYPFDLSQPADVDKNINKILEDAGGVDILINAAGVSQRSLTKDTSLTIDRYLMEVNYFGAIALTKAVLPYMLEKESGQIVTISSVVGKFGAPLRSSYSASKHALHGFMDSLRAEIWDTGIAITLVCPGYVRTNASVNALTASGTPHGQMDDAHDRGMPPATCAKKIVRAIEKRKQEVNVGGYETLGVYIYRFTPNYFSRIIRMLDFRVTR